MPRIVANLLSPRQEEVLTLMTQGKHAAEIATLLDLTKDTVHQYAKLARKALGVETTEQAIAWARQNLGGVA